MSDKKKVASAAALYAPVGLDILFNNENAKGRAARGNGAAAGAGLNRLVDRQDSYLAQHLAAGGGGGGVGARFVLAINFLMPWGSFVTYLSPRPGAAPPGSCLSGDPRCDPMVARLCSGDEAYCRSRLKLVPNVVKGSLAIKKMVGTKPAIIGKVLKACHRGQSWLEVQLDASWMAASATIEIG